MKSKIQTLILVLISLLVGYSLVYAASGYPVETTTIGGINLGDAETALEYVGANFSPCFVPNVVTTLSNPYMVATTPLLGTGSTACFSTVMSGVWKDSNGDFYLMTDPNIVGYTEFNQGSLGILMTSGSFSYAGCNTTTYTNNTETQTGVDSPNYVVGGGNPFGVVVFPKTLHLSYTQSGATTADLSPVIAALTPTLGLTQSGSLNSAASGTIGASTFQLSSTPLPAVDVKKGMELALCDPGEGGCSIIKVIKAAVTGVVFHIGATTSSPIASPFIVPPAQLLGASFGGQFEKIKHAFEFTCISPTTGCMTNYFPGAVIYAFVSNSVGGQCVNQVGRVVGYDSPALVKGNANNTYGIAAYTSDDVSQMSSVLGGSYVGDCTSPAKGIVGQAVVVNSITTGATYQEDSSGNFFAADSTWSLQNTSALFTAANTYFADLPVTAFQSNPNVVSWDIGLNSTNNGPAFEINVLSGYTPSAICTLTNLPDSIYISNNCSIVYGSSEQYSMPVIFNVVSGVPAS